MPQVTVWQITAETPSRAPRRLTSAEANGDRQNRRTGTSTQISRSDRSRRRSTNAMPKSADRQIAAILAKPDVPAIVYGATGRNIQPIRKAARIARYSVMRAKSPTVNGTQAIRMYGTIRFIGLRCLQGLACSSSFHEFRAAVKFALWNAKKC